MRNTHDVEIKAESVRRQFLAVSGLVAAGAVAAGGAPPASADEYILASQKGAARGVAPLDGDKTIPLANLGRGVRKGESVFNVKDFGANGTDSGDDTGAIQDAIAAAAVSRGVVVFPSGVYPVDGLTVPHLVTLEGVAGATSRYVAWPRGGVVLRRIGDGHTGSLLTIDGVGVTLRNLTFLGGRKRKWVDGNWVEQGVTTVARPSVVINEGFECCLDSIRIADALGIALDVGKANNTRWHDIFIDDSGTEALPAMRIWSNRGDKYDVTNNLDIDGLTVETCVGVGLEIASTAEMSRDNNPETGAAASGGYAEFVKISRLHMERGAADVNHQQPLIKAGNVWHLEIVEPTFAYGPGPILEVETTEIVGRRFQEYTGRVTVLGGAFVGAVAADGGKATEHLVRVKAGSHVSFVGSRFERVARQPIRIEAEFTGTVVVDEGSSILQGVDNWNFFEDRRTDSGSRPSWQVKEGFPSVAPSIGSYLFSEHVISSSGQAYPWSGAIQFVPFLVREKMSVDAITFEVTKAASGATHVVKLGLWRDRSDGKGPWLEMGPVAEANGPSVTTVGVKDATFSPVGLAFGRYWAGMLYCFSAEESAARAEFRLIDACLSLPSSGGTWNGGGGFKSLARGNLVDLPTRGTVAPDVSGRLLALRRSG